MSDLLQTAINAALSQDWQKAITANQNLLKENKNDVNSMNRLAHAYAQMGKIPEAKKLYKKILTLDKYNIIAQKNLEKLNALPKSAKSNQRLSPLTYSLSPSQFLEEPGKTKTVALKNTAPASVLSHLNPGTPVVLFPKKHSIDIRTLNKIYIGALPDDFAFRLLRFLKVGYEYESFIKSASKNSVAIFIREIKRAKRFKSQPTFPTTSAGARSMLRDHKDIDETDEGSENAQEGLEE